MFSSLFIAFCCIDGFYQHHPDLRTIIFQFLIFCVINIIRFQQKFQPITCFVGFFQCYLQFGNEICFTVGILCFVDIGSDTGSGSADLIGNYRFVLAFQRFYQIENLYGKVNCSERNLLSAIMIISFSKFNIALVRLFSRRQRRRLSEAQNKNYTNHTPGGRKLHKWSVCGMSSQESEANASYLE